MEYPTLFEYDNILDYSNVPTEEPLISLTPEDLAYYCTFIDQEYGYNLIKELQYYESKDFIK